MVVVGQNDVNWSYIYVCGGDGALLNMCSFMGHKRANVCDIVTEGGRIFQHSFFRQTVKLNTNPLLNLILPATHRPAAVLLLTLLQPTV